MGTAEHFCQSVHVLLVSNPLRLDGNSAADICRKTLYNVSNPLRLDGNYCGCMPRAGIA